MSYDRDRKRYGADQRSVAQRAHDKMQRKLLSSPGVGAGGGPGEAALFGGFDAATHTAGQAHVMHAYAQAPSAAIGLLNAISATLDVFRAAPPGAAAASACADWLRAVQLEVIAQADTPQALEPGPFRDRLAQWRAEGEFWRHEALDGAAQALEATFSAFAIDRLRRS